MITLKESIEIYQILQNNEYVICLDTSTDQIDESNLRIYPIVYSKRKEDGKVIKTKQVVHTKKNGDVEDISILQGQHAIQRKNERDVKSGEIVKTICAVRDKIFKALDNGDLVAGDPNKTLVITDYNTKSDYTKTPLSIVVMLNKVYNSEGKKTLQLVVKTVAKYSDFAGSLRSDGKYQGRYEKHIKIYPGEFGRNDIKLVDK